MLKRFGIPIGQVTRTANRNHSRRLLFSVMRRGPTCYKGLLTHEETSALQNKPWIRPEDVLGIADRRLDPAPPATVTRSDNFYRK